MAVSLTRPDPSSPNAVAGATFSTARRGFEQTEVRDLLRMVAAELARLQERERYLDRELRAAQRSAPVAAVALDEEVVTRLLGEEAARILQTAREAASHIKIRAEETAARVLREASDEAQRMREEAAVEAARRRQDAAADADSELQMAKQQGREMVNEARAYRERVLSELGRRRELARQQIEQLVHGRDRLLQAFERARLAAVDVVAEMTPLGEPEELPDAPPSTGPVAVTMPGAAVPDHPTVPLEAAPTGDPSASVVESIAPVGATSAAAEVGGEAGVEDTDRPSNVVALFAGELEREIDGGADVERSEVALPTTTEVVDQGRRAESDAESDVARRDVVQVDDEPVEVQSVEDEPVEDEPVEDEPVEVQPVEDEPVEVESGDDEPVEIQSDDDRGKVQPVEDEAVQADSEAVDDLFARLRAARAESVAQRAQIVDGPGGAPAGPSVDADPTRTLTRPGDLSVFAASPLAPVADVELDETSFGRRDAQLTAVIVGSARKLKRVLADEQNDVLHTLRRRDPVRSIDVLLMAGPEHAQRYVGIIEAELRTAALAGAASIASAATEESDEAGDDPDDAISEAVRAAAEALSTAVVAPLRERLSRAIVDAAGDNSELASLARGIYREWKVQRIDEHLDDVARIAFGRGAVGALPPSMSLTWVPDPRFPVCADCADNVLAGAVSAGDEFPTGHVAAPAHDGCRCMLAAVDR